MNQNQIEEAGRLVADLEERDKYIIQNGSAILNDINKIFTKHGIPDILGPDDLSIWKEYVGDLFIESKKLSSSIINFCFPSIPSSKVYHYTNRLGAVSIFNSNKFRMYAIKKYLNQEEFYGFYEGLGLEGYKIISKSDPSLYNSIVDGLFVGSFTDTLDNEDLMWSNFGDGRSGVRIEFEIISKVPDFRRIKYDWGGKTKLIKELSDMLRATYGSYLCFSEISKIGAFYIGGFSNEKECRLLLKKGSDRYPFLVTVESDSIGQKYIELEIGPNTNPYYDLSITGVLLGNYCDKQEFIRACGGGISQYLT